MSAGSPIRASIGPYRVIDCVGSGGMGTVYRVCHRQTGRIAAAKVMHAESVGGTGLERFRNEGRIHQALVHPCIAMVHEYLEIDGVPCLVMDYVEGETLEERLRRVGPLPFADAMRYFTALVDAVGYLHQRGIVHRDVKTNNVKLDGPGEVKLLDFGIATSHGTPRLTSTGNVVGTLLVLSPEQLRTGRAEPRSDIWSLGILLYEMLTGRPPFEAMAPGLLTERILRGTYVSPSQRRPELPRDVDRIVDRCLRVRLEDRYASCEALLTDVESLVRSTGPKPEGWTTPQVLFSQSGEIAQSLARQWRLMGSGVAASAALVFFVWAIWPSAQVPPREPLGPGITADTPATIAIPNTVVEPIDRQDRFREPDRRFEAPANDASAPGANVRSVTIRVLEGSAEVYQDGRRVGQTPYRFNAPIGTEVSMMLRRDGCEDATVKLRVEEGMNEFIESLRRCRTP
jgi:serine/threonine-protein kinase